MNEEIAIKICEQMTYDIDNLCDCCRKNEKDRTCIGCRELAIETILKENARLKDKIDKAVECIKNVDKYEETLNDYTRIYMIQDVDIYEIEKILKEN